MMVKKVNFGKKYVMMVVLVLSLFILTACTAGGRTANDPAGFLLGVWHGWIAPFVLIVSFFNEDLMIYEVHNVGFWYNLGFYMAIISGFGSLSLCRRSNRGRR